MALKLKNKLQDLYRKISGVPKSELKSQGEMIRKDWKGKPGSDYRMKSAILNAHNLKGNFFRPKGGKVVHAALDLAAPLLGSSDVGRAAMTAARLATRGRPPYSEYTALNPIVSTKTNSIERKYGFAYDNEKSFPTTKDGKEFVPDYDLGADDIVPVRIGKYQFRGAISSLTDSSSPSWGGSSYAGRPDQIYSYTGVERTISFDLKIYAVSHTQLRNMYQRVNKLYDLVRPTPDDLMAPTRMSAPFTRLTIGNYISEAVIMTSLTMAPIEELPWEIGDPDAGGDYPSKTLHPIYRLLSGVPKLTPERYIVPRGLNINLGFTVLHDAPPTTANAVFRSTIEKIS
jgi:hypothetical protein